MRENILKIFSNKGKIKKNYIKLYNDLDDSQKMFIDSSFSDYSSIKDKIISIINNKYRNCPICDSVMLWDNPNKTCSNDCTKKSRELTSLERYGTKNPKQNKDIQEKIKQTNLERYGVEYPAQNKDIYNKVKQTNLEKYGSYSTFENKDIQEKIKQSNLERYGVEYPQQNKQIRQKSIEKNIEKYGVDTNFKNKDVQEKIKQTNLERYGVEYPQQNKQIRQKSILRLNDTKLSLLKDNYGIDFNGDISISFSKVYSKEYLYSLTSTNKVPLDILKNEFSNSQYIINARKNNHEIESNRSSYELEIIEYLKTLKIQNIVISSKRIISPYELDIYIPEHKLAIEFNGSYWHSDKFKDKYYHQMKTKMCNEKGITLINVYEYLYNTQADIYKSIIKSKLQLNERVYARKCILKEVLKHEEKDFLNKYHLQGFVGSSKCYGLYINEELLTLCSFGKSRFNKKYEYELLRNCSKPGVTVVGGLSKIIKHYKKEIDNKEIICYSDASISYNKNSDLTIPNYVWVKQSIVYRRYQTMKHKLEKILGIKYNNTKTEDENMINNGFIKIYDSGNYK